METNFARLNSGIPNDKNAKVENSRYINGRKYHNVESSKYPLPNDDEEFDRLHRQHSMIRYAWQSNFSAPVKDILNSEGSKVLDVGCGAGSWALEIATNYRNAEVVGIDMSPVQPLSIKLQNVTFVLGNILDGLPFANNSFDYVFQRLLFTAIPKDKWPYVINELTRVLKPGGYLELMEFDPETKRIGPVSAKLLKTFINVLEQRNVFPMVFHELHSLCEQQGQLENIKREEKSIFKGAESGKLGQMAIDDLASLFYGVKSHLKEILEVSSEEYDEMVQNMSKEMREYDSYLCTVRVYAIKKIN